MTNINKSQRTESYVNIKADSEIKGKSTDDSSISARIDNVSQNTLTSGVSGKSTASRVLESIQNFFKQLSNIFSGSRPQATTYTSPVQKQQELTAKQQGYLKGNADAIFNALEQPANLKTEGILRVSGNKKNVNATVSDLLNKPLDEDALADTEVHVLTGALKAIIREHMRFLEKSDLDGIAVVMEQKKVAIKNKEDTAPYDKAVSNLIKHAIERLPECHQTILAKTMDYLFKVAEHSEDNKMTPHNLAIVIGPNANKAALDGSLDMTQELALNEKCVRVIEEFIVNKVPAAIENEDEDISSYAESASFNVPVLNQISTDSGVYSDFDDKSEDDNISIKSAQTMEALDENHYHGPVNGDVYAKPIPKNQRTVRTEPTPVTKIEAAEPTPAAKVTQADNVAKVAQVDKTHATTRAELAAARAAFFAQDTVTGQQPTAAKVAPTTLTKVDTPSTIPADDAAIPSPVKKGIAFFEELASKK